MLIEADVVYACQKYHVIVTQTHEHGCWIVSATSDDYIDGVNRSNMLDAFFVAFNKLRLLSHIRRSIVFWRKHYASQPYPAKYFYDKLYNEVTIYGQRIVIIEILRERLDRLIEYATRPDSEWTQKLMARQMRGVQ